MSNRDNTRSTESALPRLTGRRCVKAGVAEYVYKDPRGHEVFTKTRYLR